MIVLDQITVLAEEMTVIVLKELTVIVLYYITLVVEEMKEIVLLEMTVYVMWQMKRPATKYFNFFFFNNSITV